MRRPDDIDEMDDWDRDDWQAFDNSAEKRVGVTTSVSFVCHVHIPHALAA